MPGIILNNEENSTLVFKLLPAITYRTRMIIAIILIFIGLIIQQTGQLGIYIGYALIAFGNSLLLVNGYDNRIKFGIYSAGSKWEEVEEDKITEVIQLERKMKRWDTSILDISNSVGFIIFAVLTFFLFCLFMHGVSKRLSFMNVFAIDAALLFIPHWLTGLRRISEIISSELNKKMNVLTRLVYSTNSALEQHQLSYLMLLQDKSNLPKDIKIKVDIDGQDEKFLGYYGQLAINNVKGTIYPYFYVVLVARKNYGLKNYKSLVKREKKASGFFSSLLAQNDNFICEYKKQKDVEVLVIRQYTTRTSGYHTNTQTVKELFLTGLEIAEAAAKRIGV